MNKKNSFPFDTPGFRIKVDKRRMELGDTELVSLSLTKLWYCSVLLKKKNLEAMTGQTCLFYNNPPIPSSRILRPNPVPRVLVVGTSGEVAKLRFENPLAPEARVSEVYKICLGLGLGEVRLTWSSEASSFWGNFFNENEFLDARAVCLPGAIITTGNIRSHDQDGRGETINCLGRLQQIRKKWRIPVEQIPKIHS